MHIAACRVVRASSFLAIELSMHQAGGVPSSAAGISSGASLESAPGEVHAAQLVRDP